MAPIRIALIDDHPAILSAAANALRSSLEVEEAILASSLGEVEDQGPFDVVILDLQLRDGTAPGENVATLVDYGWPVLLYTQEVNPAVVARCFQAGATGVVSKSEELDALVDAVTVIAGGQPYLSGDWASALESQSIPNLTPREAEALRLYAAGLPMKSVARRMGITVDTVNEHLMRVRRRYAQAGRPVESRTDLYVRALEDGLLPLPTGV